MKPRDPIWGFFFTIEASREVGMKKTTITTACLMKKKK